jgi:uncharacterized protein
MSLEQEILKSCKTVAVVGISSDETRASNRVGRYLKNQGYKIIPVNPNEIHVLGETCYPDLKAIPEKVDVVDIFRRAEEVPPIINQAIAIQAKAIWMQEGIKNEQAAEKARLAGLKVIQDRCMMKEHHLING